MTEQRIANGLMLQVRRRRLTAGERQWLCNYHSPVDIYRAGHRKNLSSTLLWIFLCAFIGAGTVQVLTMLGGERLQAAMQWMGQFQ